MANKLPHNRTWYTKKLCTLAKSCAKERDGYVCQMCGKDCYGSDAHGSHVFNVGSHKAMEIDPTNIKCLCSHCHLWVWHKDPVMAGDWFKKKFPERLKYLHEVSKAKIKLSTVDLAELYDKVRGKDWKVYAKEYIKLIEEKLNNSRNVLEAENGN